MTAFITDTRQVSLDELVEYPGNSRVGDVEGIAESLSTNGQYKPIVVQESTMHVLAGNHTLKAARELGWQTICCSIVICDDAEAERINLVDNKLPDGGGYDAEKLHAQLDRLGGDFAGTGYAQPDVDSLLKSIAPTGGGDTAPADPPNDPITQSGDVIRLGDHILVCGDTLDQQTWLDLFPDGERADLFVTSPPYNQKLETFQQSGMHKGNSWVGRMAEAYSDSLPENVYRDQQTLMMGLCATYGTEGAALFYNHKCRYREKRAITPLFPDPWIPESWQLRQEIIWDRAGTPTLNARMFMPIDERIYWFTRSGDFYFDNTPEVKAWGSVWRISPIAEIKSSVSFPLELPTRCIRAASKVGDIVMDPYSGTGTTMIAAENLLRVARCIEINPAYCDVIVDRWERHTGRKAQRAAR